MAIISTAELLRRVPLFSPLSLEEANLLANESVKRSYRRGEHIVKQGHTAQAIYILLSGQARVIWEDEQEHEVILATLGAGDCVGEMGVLDQQPHSAHVQAQNGCDVLMIEREAFLRCIESSSGLAMAMIRSLVYRLRQADHKIESLALLKVHDRILDALRDMSKMQGEQQVVTQKITKQDIAKMVGASREMVSRAMKELEEQGAIHTSAEGWLVLSENGTDKGSAVSKVA